MALTKNNATTFYENMKVNFKRIERSSISVVRVFEDDTFILYEFLLRGEMFNLAINPALRLYNVTHWLSFYLL